MRIIMDRNSRPSLIPTLSSSQPPMMSKTQHYRKVTKPLLERKRRARMNHYLDELKDLIIETMESQGEHVTKLEKADILEMTVSYLKTKTQSNNSSPPSAVEMPNVNTEKFRAGYTQAAYEVSKVFSTIPGIDVKFGTKMMKHLGYKLKDLNLPESTEVRSLGQLSPPQSPDLHRQQENRLITPPLRTPPPAEQQQQQQQQQQQNVDVWRPW